MVNEVVEKIAIEKQLGISVKNWRTRLGLPQDALALRAGLQRSYISDVERGSRNVSLKSIEKLADALDYVLLDCDLRSRLVREGRQSFQKNFTWNVVREKYRDALESVAA